MEVATVSETLHFQFILAWLPGQEDFAQQNGKIKVGWYSNEWYKIEDQRQ
jgi:hypothetical protein